MILLNRNESNPKATVWNGSEKFMPLNKYLLPNFKVAFVNILQNNQKFVSSIW